MIELQNTRHHERVKITNTTRYSHAGSGNGVRRGKDRDMYGLVLGNVAYVT